MPTKTPDMRFCIFSKQLKNEMFLPITCLWSMIEIPLPDTVNGLSPRENQSPENQDPEDPKRCGAPHKKPGRTLPD
jgi:hypothetical protein